MTNRIKVITFGRKMHISGGIQKYIYNLYSTLDKELVDMKFIIPNRNIEEQPYLEEIIENGGKIHFITPHKESLWRFLTESFKVFSSYRDHILHIHVTGGIHALVGVVAKLAGIKKIIYHSHNASFIETKPIVLGRPIFRLTGTKFLGCTSDALKYMFGDKILLDERSSVAINGVDLYKYQFNKNDREHVRKLYGVEQNTILLGFVGRLSPGKNIVFLLEVLNKLVCRYGDAKLMILGSGPLEQEFLYKAKDMQLFDKIIMVGSTNKVEKYMSAFDYLLLPSYYESLGLVLIEGQANGLICIGSDLISRESKLTNSMKYIKLSSKEWVNEILKNLGYDRDSLSNIYEIEQKGYSVEATTREMEKLYKKIESS